MLHSIIIANARGVLLLARYLGGGTEAWDAEGSKARTAWERRLWSVGAPWASGPKEKKENGAGVNLIDQWTVVWRTAGDLTVFLAGDDEYDELVLAEQVWPVVRDLLKEHLSDKLTETALLRSDIYGKVGREVSDMRDSRIDDESMCKKRPKYSRYAYSVE